MFFNNLIIKEDKMKIIMNHSIDLDAVCSIWAARQFIPGAKDAVLEFLPVDWNREVIIENDTIFGIDIDGRGIKGKKEDGVVYSCFSTIIKNYAPMVDQLALASFVNSVDEQDVYASAMKFLVSEKSYEAQEAFSKNSLNAVLRALQVMNPHDNFIVIERMSEILSGILQARRKYRYAVTEADKAEILPNRKVAIVMNSRELATNAILFEERGIRVIVYVNGNNIGLIRNKNESLRMSHNEFRAIVEDKGESNEWFDYSGIIFFRGSSKAPAQTPSKVDPKDLAVAANWLLS